jgi:hypothetical protein
MEATATRTHTPGTANPAWQGLRTGLWQIHVINRTFFGAGRHV